MVQGAKHMKSNNAAANGGSSPQPKPQPKPKRRRKRLPRWADRLITIVIILIGVGLMTWPWILDRLEASGVFNQISTVSSTVDALSAEERERILLQARSFNEQLAGEATELPADQIEPYAQQLIFDRDPMMSWVEIPSIDVSMPIYHGTSEEVLMAGVGHLEGTSLPVGGTSTHCVLTAHSGMRNLSMFDDIHSLEPGDLVLLHTMGGDVEAGLAIAELIAGMRTPTVSLVLGGGHSIGVPLAVSARQSFIVPSATMTIHPVRMSGTVIAAPETYRYFERIRERIVKFVAAHSHISEDRFRQLMLASGDMANDVGTVLYGEEAVTLGIIDHVGGLSDALDSLYRQMDRRREE